MMYVCLWIVSPQQMVSLELLWHFIVSDGWWLIVGKSQRTQFVKIRLFAMANFQTEFQQMWQFYQDVKIRATHRQIKSGSCLVLRHHSGLLPVSGDCVSVSSLITWSFQMAHSQFFSILPDGSLCSQDATLPGFSSLPLPTLLPKELCV